MVTVVARTGEDGLARLDKASYSVVLLDLVLPDLDGLELLRRINLRPLTSRPPVVLVSGLGTIRSAVDAIRLGASDFVEKPVVLEELIDVVRSAGSHLPVHAPDSTSLNDVVAWVRSVFLAPVDTPTVQQWAELCGTSVAVTFARCARLALRPKPILDLARLIRLAGTPRPHRNADIFSLLDVRDERTVQALLARSGLREGQLDNPDTVLAHQELVPPGDLTEALAQSWARWRR